MPLYNPGGDGSGSPGSEQIVDIQRFGGNRAGDTNLPAPAAYTEAIPGVGVLPIADDWIAISLTISGEASAASEVDCRIRVVEGTLLIDEPIIEATQTVTAGAQWTFTLHYLYQVPDDGEYQFAVDFRASAGNLLIYDNADFTYQISATHYTGIGISV